MSALQTADSPEIVSRSAREAQVRQLCEAGDLRAAVAAALELYGGELNGFLAATSFERDSVAELNAEMCEALCADLARFEWRSSLRTWMYSLARNARLRYQERQRRNEARQVPLSRVPDPAASPATSVAAYQRTTMKERLAVARAQLEVEERELLVLRVDRGLSWSEIATVLAGADQQDVPRASAALRKRFERTLDKLRRIFDQMAAAQRS